MSGSIQLVTSGLALQCDDVERREAGELARSFHFQLMSVLLVVVLSK